MGSLWPSWGPRAGSGARPGPGPAGPWASEEKPKKTIVFYLFFYTSDLRGWTARLSGKDVSGPVEDLLNENPSHVALGKLTTTNPRATGAQNPPQTPPPHAPGPFGRLGAPVADFGLPLAPFGYPWAPFGRPLGSLWPSWGTCGIPLGHLGLPCGVFWILLKDGRHFPSTCAVFSIL